MATFIRSSEDKAVVSDLVSEAGKRILCGKNMAFKPSIDPAVPPRLFLVVRYDRSRDCYVIRDRETNIDFPHSVSQRELSIGERSRDARDPLIQALVDYGLDSNPWLKEGQVADPPRPGSPAHRTFVPPASLPAAPPLVPPVPPGLRPQYYPGQIPVPIAISGPPAPPAYPPGFGPVCPGYGMPPPGFLPRGPAPYWSPPPFPPTSVAAPIPVAADPLLEMNRRLAEMEAAQAAEARRLGALKVAGRSGGRSSVISVEAEDFCRSVVSSSLIQGGKPGLLSQLSQLLDAALAPAQQQPFANLALLCSTILRLRNMKFAFLGDYIVNKAKEACENGGDLSIEANRRKVEQTIISFYREQMVTATNLQNKYPDQYFDKPK